MICGLKLPQANRSLRHAGWTERKKSLTALESRHFKLFREYISIYLFRSRCIFKRHRHARKHFPMRGERRTRGKLQMAYGLLEVVNPLSRKRYSARVA